jgi:hypothetical protein
MCYHQAVLNTDTVERSAFQVKLNEMMEKSTLLLPLPVFVFATDRAKVYSCPKS